MTSDDLIQKLRDHAGELDEDYRLECRNREHPIACLLREAAQMISDQQDYIDNLERGAKKK